MPLISNCSMMPAWHQLVSMSGHVEESETARKLQLYATSIYQVHSFVCQLDYNTYLSGRGTLSYFIEIPVIRQLQDTFLRENFHADLQHCFNRGKKDVHNIEDIYDGKLYQQYVKNEGLLSSPYNISLFWYTDGIPLFKSAAISLWPLYFCINELPHMKRTMKENILIAVFGLEKANRAWVLF